MSNTEEPFRSDQGDGGDVEEEDVILNFSCVVYEVTGSGEASQSLEWAPLFNGAWCGVELTLQQGGKGSISIAPVPVSGQTAAAPFQIDIASDCKWKRVKSRFVALRRGTPKGSLGFFFVNDKRARQFLTLVYAASMPPGSRSGYSSQHRRPVSVSSTASSSSTPPPDTALFAPARSPTTALSPRSQGSRFSFPLELMLEEEAEDNATGEQRTGGGGSGSGSGSSYTASTTQLTNTPGANAGNSQSFGPWCPPELAQLASRVFAALDHPSPPQGLFREPPSGVSWNPRKRKLTEYFLGQHDDLQHGSSMDSPREEWKTLCPSDAREAAEAIKVCCCTNSFCK